MSGTEHTPGPWKVQPGETFIGPYNRGLMVGPLQYAKVHVIGPFEKPIDNETRANARLIAAAPELLAALRWLLDVYTDACGIEVSEAHPETAAGKARAAIAKAIGG